MPGKPSFQFYPGDWKKDPNLSMCSPATRGIWMDIICAIHESKIGSITGTPEQLSRTCRCTTEEVISALDELAKTETANVTCPGDVTNSHSEYTVTSRRLDREVADRKSGRERKQRQRDREKKHTDYKKSHKSHDASSSSSSSSSSNTGKRAGVLSIVTDEILASPERVLDWFKLASNGDGRVLEPTEGNKINVVALAQRVICDFNVEYPVKVFVACVRDKDFQITGPEEDRAIAAIKLIEQGPPPGRSSDLSSTPKSRDQHVRDLVEWEKKRVNDDPG